MKPVCCVCSGRHHPLNCTIAVRALEQCTEPTPDDYTGPRPLTAAACDTVVVDLLRHRTRRSPEPAVVTSGRRAARHRAASRSRWRAS